MIEVVEKAIETETDLRQDENTTFNSDDNVLLDGIANDKYSFGFFGYAYFVSNSDKVKAVPIVNKTATPCSPATKLCRMAPIILLPAPVHLREQRELEDQTAGCRIREVLLLRNGRSRDHVRCRLQHAPVRYIRSEYGSFGWCPRSVKIKKN